MFGASRLSGRGEPDEPDRRRAGGARARCSGRRAHRTAIRIKRTGCCFGTLALPSVGAEREGTVFQIGESLRDARQRRGLELAEVEQATKVRERYLRALEEERFDELPAGGYRKTFLRGYATYLDLDADAFVDEYVSRFEKPESVEIELAPPVRRRRRPVRWMWPAAAAAALAIGLIAWLAPASQHAARRAAVRPVAAAAPKPAATHTSPSSRPSAGANRERAVRVVFARFRSVSGKPTGCTRRSRTPGSSSTASRPTSSASRAERCSTRSWRARPIPRSWPSSRAASCVQSCPRSRRRSRVVSRLSTRS
ncbi:MAG: helix-turn-helix domain-containing protein [Actinobacteria bacterium]|nr:MAG: helix-turn-helix domain-containing protein [Actinomycetota bacterium]